MDRFSLSYNNALYGLLDEIVFSWSMSSWDKAAEASTIFMLRWLVLTLSLSVLSMRILDFV